MIMVAEKIEQEFAQGPRCRELSNAKYDTVMTETVDAIRAAQQARRWALIVPREHGAWGLLLVPLFTGVAAAFAAAHRVWPLLMFTTAALTLFWLRTPVESFLGTSPSKVTTSQERWTVLIASLFLAAVAAVCLTGLMWQGQNLELLLLGAAAAFAFGAQAVIRRLGRGARMTAQLVGAMGLTCTAPAAYYIGTGQLSERALVLWAANWIFAGNQIHFVQLRIHGTRAANFSEKFTRGWAFFLAQPLLLTALALAPLWRAVPPLTIMAFIPALVRGTLWFFRKPEALDVKNLGWSEVKQGVLFGTLVAIAFIYS